MQASQVYKVRIRKSVHTVRWFQLRTGDSVETVPIKQWALLGNVYAATDGSNCPKDSSRRTEVHHT